MSSRSVTPRVEYQLKNYPTLRDSDKELLLAIWSQEGFHLSDTQRAAFMRTTPAESITRSRRALRDAYPDSKQADKARYTRMVEEQNDHGTHYQRTAEIVKPRTRVEMIDGELVTVLS